MIQLHLEERSSGFLQKSLGGFAVWAVGFGEDDYLGQGELALALLRVLFFGDAYIIVNLPTALSAMIPSALVLASDMASSDGAVAKEPKRRLNIEEVVGNGGDEVIVEGEDDVLGLYVRGRRAGERVEMLRVDEGRYLCCLVGRVLGLIKGDAERRMGGIVDIYEGG